MKFLLFLLKKLEKSDGNLLKKSIEKLECRWMELKRYGVRASCSDKFKIGFCIQKFERAARLDGDIESFDGKKSNTYLSVIKLIKSKIRGKAPFLTRFQGKGGDFWEKLK